MDDAVILAADNNISLQRQRISLNTLEKKKDTSWNGISPSLSASGTMSIPFESDSKLSYSVSASASLNFTPSLFTAIKTPLNANSPKEIILYDVFFTLSWRISRFLRSTTPTLLSLQTHIHQ